jgi:hypothetical protein
LLSRFGGREPQETEQAFEALEIVLQAGAKWDIDERKLRGLRRDLADGDSRTVVRLIELLRKYGAFTADQLHELTRTPAVRRVMNGISKPRRDLWGLYAPAPQPVAAPAGLASEKWTLI